jgi:Spy/CpxP family protein refolding chaperone
LNIKAIKEQYQDKAEREAALAKQNAKVEEQTGKLHKEYLNKLAKHLTPQQIEGVKDGMTYGVLPLTYKAYQEQILTLTEDQKKQILVWLTEAREKAMDAESSDKKHAMFGKYKGKINNYLSAAGYDLKKEGIEWQKRINAAKAN